MELVGAGYLAMKAQRANLHLDALNRELDLFLEEPYTVVRKDDVQKGRHIRRTEMKPNDPVIAMLLGEFLYCLRSGLDQMAWQLSTSLARQNKPTDICFPIYDDIGKPESRRNYLKILQCFPSSVAKEIDAIQPHNGVDPPQTHPLWQLHKLCNLDKHCLIPLHSRSAPAFVPHVPGVLFQDLPAEDAFEISVPIENKHDLDFEPDAASQIEFGEWSSDWIVPRHRLSDIQGFIVSTVLPIFKQFRFWAATTIELRVADVRTVYRR